MEFASVTLGMRSRTFGEYSNKAAKGLTRLRCLLLDSNQKGFSGTVSLTGRRPQGKGNIYWGDYRIYPSQSGNGSGARLGRGHVWVSLLDPSNNKPKKMNGSL